MKDNKEVYSEAIETEVKDGVKLSDEDLEDVDGGGTYSFRIIKSKISKALKKKK
ncbi:MAG: hypothetical protein LIO87_10945 [Eubacterium sp.]|nr:hypothetical protein [Eubacterium sp.]